MYVYFRLAVTTLSEAVAEDVHGGAEIGAWVRSVCLCAPVHVSQCLATCRPFKLNEVQFNECSFRCGRVLHENIEVYTYLVTIARSFPPLPLPPPSSFPYHSSSTAGDGLATSMDWISSSHTTPTQGKPCCNLHATTTMYHPSQKEIQHNM